MANLIHMYQGSVTAGGIDGTILSEGDETAPLNIGPLNATSNEESSPVKVALRCDTGYKTSGNTTITPTGVTNTMWALAPDNAGVAGTFGAYGAALTISSEIVANNTIFWVKAKAANTENPANDVSVDLVVNALIVIV